MSESSSFFIDLQPPGGGLQRLQRVLGAQSHKTHSSGWRFAAGAFAMSLLALAWFLPGVVAQYRQTARLVSSMRAAVTPPAGGIHVVDGAAIELPNGQPGICLYLVQSITPTTDTEPD